MENVYYLDNGAATRLDEQVLEVMKPLYFDRYSVATSEFGYSLGVEAKEALDEALHLFLRTAMEMGTLDEILQEAGYGFRDGIWVEPALVTVERRLTAVGA